MYKIKSFVYVLLVLALGAGLWYGWQYFTRKVVSIDKPIDAIPENYAFILRIQGPSSFINIAQNDSLIINRLGLLPHDSSAASLLSFMQMLNQIEQQRQNKQPVFISVHFMGHNKFSLLLTSPVGKGLDKNSIQKQLLKYGTFTINQSEGYDVYNLQMKNHERFYISLNKGVLSMTPSRLLLDKVLFQLKNNIKISGNRLTAKMLKMTGETPMSLYVNYRFFYRWTAMYAPNYRETLRTMLSMAEKAELDVQVKDRVLSLSGYSLASDSLPSLIKVLKNQPPQSFTMKELLPYNTSLLYYTALEDYPKFYNDVLPLLSFDSTEAKHMEKKYHFNIRKHILSWINKEVAYVNTAADIKSLSDNAYAVMGLTDAREAAQQLQQIAEKASSLNKIPLDTFAYRSYRISGLGIPYFIPNIFGATFDKLTKSYYTLVNNYVVWANSPAALKRVIDAYLLGKTLNNDVDFQQVLAHCSDNFNILIFSDINKYKRLQSHFLSADKQALIDSLNYRIDDLGSIAIELSSGDEGIYTAMALVWKGSHHDNDEPVGWQEVLDAPAAGKAYLVKNHRNNSEDVLVFDRHNFLYRIGKSGHIAWKIPVMEKPMSDIFVLDFYKNNKYQYVFNTANYIYIVDINGNRVEDYPKKLPLTATGSMSLMDYDHRKNYRILLPLEDGKLHNFLLDGSETPGWTNPYFGRDFISPVHHYRLKTKDFLLFVDTLGNVVFANRRGESRMEARLAFTNNPRTPFYTVGSGNLKRLVTTDMMGRVITIDAEGNVDKTLLEEFSSRVKFLVSDFDMDGNKDYVFLDQNRLSVYNSHNEKLIDTLLNTKIRQLAAVPLLSSDSIRLIMNAADDNRLIFIKSSGEVLDNKEFYSNENFLPAKATKNNYLRLITINQRVISNYLFK